jgi:hypothetical protein
LPPFPETEDSVSRRRTILAPPPGIVNIPTVKVACGGVGVHHRAPV